MMKKKIFFQENVVDLCFTNQGHHTILLGSWNANDLKYFNEMAMPFI